MYPTKQSKKHPIRNRPSYPATPNFPKNYDNTIEYEEDDESEEESPEFDQEFDYQNVYYEPETQKKKQKTENSTPNYGFAPLANPNSHKNPFFVQNSRENWSENETFVLLEAWGNRFIQLGRKSLRGEDWAEVAERVNRTERECRDRLEVLKKKYMREKAKIEETGGGYLAKWAFFKKMDVLLNLKDGKGKQQCGLACGVDSGEYVFMDSSVYLKRSNGLDEMRDSPGESEQEEEEEEEEDGGTGFGDEERCGGGLESLSMLADSIHKFGEIYEKIESSKKKQMMELEKMRMDFQRELELQKMQILERTQTEIAKIRGGDAEETDVSSEDINV